MSFSDLYTPGFKSRNRDHFAAIIKIAQADGIISKEEESFINRTAVNLEIEDSEVIEIKANIDSYPINPPATEQSRLERLYDLSRMVFADNIADDAEKNLLKRLVIGLGFAVDKVDQVIEKSFLEISKGSDEEEEGTIKIGTIATHPPMDAIIPKKRIIKGVSIKATKEADEKKSLTPSNSLTEVATADGEPITSLS